MGKITDYPKVTSLAQNDTLVLESNSGTKGILIKDLALALLKHIPSQRFYDEVGIYDLKKNPVINDHTGILVNKDARYNYFVSVNKFLYQMVDTVPEYNPSLKRGFYRGKNLGSVVTDEQWNEIHNGTFRDMFLGDYWYIGGHFWRIMDFDYWYATGSPQCYDHHLIIMADNTLYEAKMSTNPTTNPPQGYVGTAMYKTNLDNAKSIINGSFGSEHILNHREYLINAVKNGKPFGGAFYDSTVELPGEIMIFGSYIHSADATGNADVNRRSNDNGQLSAIRLNHTLINPCNEGYWLKDVVSGVGFSTVTNVSSPDAATYDTNFGVRPIFGIC